MQNNPYFQKIKGPVMKIKTTGVPYCDKIRLPLWQNTSNNIAMLMG